MKFVKVLLLGMVSALGMNNCDGGGEIQDRNTDIEAEVDTGTDQVLDCEAKTPAELMDCVNSETYARDLADCAVERSSGSDGWQATQDICFNRLVEAGFDVTRVAYETGVNVIGVLKGQTLPKEQVIVSAHYDHIGGCPGADDNASGVAGVLESARVLSHGSYDRTLVVACWDEEEYGLRGSESYASQARANGDDIKNTYVFEMIGYTSDEVESQRFPAGFDLLFPGQAKEIKENRNRGDFVAVIADERALSGATLFEQFVETAGTNAVLMSLSAEQTKSFLYGDLRRSDHDSFWQQDYPAIMITDTAEFRYGGYHCREFLDSVEHLNHGFAADIIRGTVAAAASELGMRSPN